MNECVFNDVVHGQMTFHPLVASIIHTPQVQRLKNIKQLGGCYYVYPSASHNRFEHCLGTAYIAGLLCDSLKKKQICPDESTWQKTKLCQQIAGLCHDLGHGPFSHTWEKFRRTVDPDDEWTHESESVKMFEDLLDEKMAPTDFNRENGLRTVRDAFNLYGLGPKDVENIKKMILGVEHPRNYLFQVINNKNNGVDVDKWDYLARDSKMLDIPIGFDYRRLIDFCRVLKTPTGDEEICFREKEASLIVDMFSARANLHDKAYQHAKVKIIEEMLVDAFVLSNKRLRLTETPVSELTDHVFQRILRDGDSGDGSEEGDGNALKAKRLLRRLETGHLYECLVTRASFEAGDSIDGNVIRERIASAESLRQYSEAIRVTSLSLDVAPGTMEKALENVLVYDEGLEVGEFDWHRYRDRFEPKLNHRQVLVLYTGETPFPSHLIPDIETRLTEILKDYSKKGRGEPGAEC